jgi:hypothetical protein
LRFSHPEISEIRAHETAQIAAATKIADKTTRKVLVALICASRRQAAGFLVREREVLL